MEDDVTQLVERLDARFKVQDERFERQDAKQVILLEKLDARFERQEERFERRDAKLDATIDRIDTKIDRIDTKIHRIDTKLDRIDAKFDGKFEALTTSRLTVWVAIISSAATIAAAVLAIIFGTPHGH